MELYLSAISLFHFRNHREARLDLGPEVNCLVGENGVGKTNLLDAVHYLSLCKSYFEPIDMHNVLHGEESFLVKGTMRTGAGESELSCAVRRGQRKVFTRDRKEYERLVDHVGRYPVVMVTPYDSQLVLDGSEVRRRFLDGLISQFDREYLEDLVRYNRALQHRNRLLKQAGAHGMHSALLEPWDEQLVVHGDRIHIARKAFMERLVPLLRGHYQGISSGPEEVDLSYRSALHEHGMRDALGLAADRDRMMQYTTAGVHRDDLLFTLDGAPLKRHGSQGQQKTYLIALKLSQFDLTLERTGVKPILLLDDIFDKIDPRRMRHLLTLLAGHRFGQVIITDTDGQRLHEALDGLQLDVRFFGLGHHGITTDETLQRTVAG